MVVMKSPIERSASAISATKKSPHPSPDNTNKSDEDMEVDEEITTRPAGNASEPTSNEPVASKTAIKQIPEHTELANLLYSNRNQSFEAYFAICCKIKGSAVKSILNTLEIALEIRDEEDKTDLLFEKTRDFLHTCANEKNDEQLVRHGGIFTMQTAAKIVNASKSQLEASILKGIGNLDKITSLKNVLYFNLGRDFTDYSKLFIKNGKVLKSGILPYCSTIGNNVV
jgi:hypothetical protein